MPSPDTADLHTNVLLSNMSIAYQNAMDAYVADRVFPFLYVDNQTNVYAKFNRGSFLTDAGAAGMLRAPGTNATLADYAVDLSSTYRADNFAIGNSVPDELRANSDALFNLDQQATLLVTEYQMIRRERAFAADFMATTKWATDVTGGSTVTKWSDYGASDPIGDIRTYKRTIQKAIAKMPNKLVMGQIVLDRLADHPDLLYRIAGGATTANAAKVSQQLIASLLDLEEILVANSVYNTVADAAAGSFTGGYVIDDVALLLYTPPAPGLLVPSAGYTFVWRTAVNGGQSPQYVRKVREDRPRRDIIESHSYWDQVMTDSSAGAFFSDIVD